MGWCAERRIKSVLPAPLTSFAPAYMASDVCGELGGEAVFITGRQPRREPWLGHVGNI